MIIKEDIKLIERCIHCGCIIGDKKKSNWKDWKHVCIKTDGWRK